MKLNSDQLAAFAAAAQTQNFSQAAKALHITQSALTQRIQQLEGTLGATLFVRSSKGVRMTHDGEVLLRHCQAVSALEAEVLAGLSPWSDRTMTGSLRVVGFSTVTRSLLIPALAPLARAFPHVDVSVSSAELRDIGPKLLQGEADMVLTTAPLERAGVRHALLGHEENVLIVARGADAVPDRFCDHDPEDGTSLQFLRLQDQTAAKFARHYFDEIYGIIDAVAAGFGRAVVPRHLIAQDTRVDVVAGYRPLMTPVYLCAFEQRFPSRLMAQAEELLRQEANRLWPSA